MAKWDKITHGNAATYRSQKYACRCDDCTAANTALAKAERNARIEKGLPEGDPRHGTATGYRTWGCKCEECRLANTLKNRDERVERKTREANG